MHSQILAILWVQWRSLWNFRTGEGLGGRMLGSLAVLLWYAMWATLAAAAVPLLADASRRNDLEFALPWALFAIFVYWQLSPLATASLGASLNLEKLLVYPIPPRRLFLFEVLLRIATGFEMLLILGGAAIGLLLNPAVRAPLVLAAFPVFVAFNLFLAAGLKNLLGRLAAFKWIHEAIVFLIVLAAALPSLLASTGVPWWVRAYFSQSPSALWPWTAAGRLALGESANRYWVILLPWTAAAYLFGRSQLEQRLEAGAAEASRPQRRGGSRPALYRIPSWLLPDPLGALVEKELRSLIRTPRFRLVFLMGFTFGFLIWVPFIRAFREGRSGPPETFPVLVSVYAVLLLSEVVFWNVFGFDRSGAQLYYAAPVSLSKVLAGKNIAAAIIVTVEVTLVCFVCVLLRLGVPVEKFFETYAVLLVLTVYMLATGNLSSVYYPRAVDPDQTWGRSSGGRYQAFLMLLFPPLASPVLLAYGARYAFDSDIAFYIVLALVAGIGGVYYWVAMDTVISAAGQRREKLLAMLVQGTGPIR